MLCHKMWTFTLDTSCVLHAVQRQAQAPAVEALLDAARAARVSLWLSAAFAADQSGASNEHLRANLEWLAGQPVNQELPGPFRLDYSALDGPDVLIDDDTAKVAEIVEEILLPPHLRVGQLDGQDEPQMAKWRRKVNDVQHLVAHHMAGHDGFVTTDFDDMIKRSRELWTRAQILVLTPTEAVALLQS